MNPTAEDFLSNLKEFASSASSMEYHLQSTMPAHPDVILQRTWPLLDELALADMNEIRECVDFHMAGKLLTYCRRCAVMALRNADEEGVRFGLYAVSVDPDVLDIRDVFRAVVLHFDVCRKHGLDFRKLFETGLRLSTERRRNQLASQFLRGPNYTKSLRAMKYTVVETDDGPTYVDGLENGGQIVNSE